MKHLTLFLLTSALSCFTLAEFEIPNDFEDGQVTSASQMNENFQALKAAIDQINAQLNIKVNFVGFSDPVIGNSGIRNVNLSCNNKFSGSRICSETEIVNSVYNDNNPMSGGRAFISRNHLGDKSCSHKEAGSYGPGLYNGLIEYDFLLCSGSYPVACCK